MTWTELTRGFKNPLNVFILIGFKSFNLYFDVNNKQTQNETLDFNIGSCRLLQFESSLWYKLFDTYVYVYIMPNYIKNICMYYCIFSIIIIIIIMFVFTCCCVWTSDSRYLIMIVLKSFTLSFCWNKRENFSTWHKQINIHLSILLIPSFNNSFTK